MSTTIFNTAIISPNDEISEICSAELSSFGSIGAIERLADYPSDVNLTRMLRLNAVDLLIVDFRDLPRAMQVIEIVNCQNTSIEIVAICPEDIKILSVLMRAGVRDYIPADSPAAGVREILASSVDKLRCKPRHPSIVGDVIAFLPSKPGSGASTIAAHTAFRASQLSRKKTLLADLDRDAPVQAFLNGLHPENFLQEALSASHKLDSDLWSQLISRRGSLEILPADADGALCAENTRTQELVAFIRRAYDLICVDLPGSLDPCSVEVLHESKRVYLVCTQELASVHIAMRKADRLKRLGLGREIRLILNRYEAGDPMTQDTVAELVGIQVEFAIPNSYSLAAMSADKGAPVDPTSSLGKSYNKLAEFLLNERVEIPRKERRLMELLYQPFTRRQGREVGQA